MSRRAANTNREVKAQQKPATARTEAEIQTAVLAYLKLVPGVTCWKAGTASFRATYKGRERFVRIGKVGVSDIIGWKAGPEPIPARVARFLAIEIKRPGKVATTEQLEFLTSVASAGGIAIVATCVEDVQKVLPTP